MQAARPAEKPSRPARRTQADRREAAEQRLLDAAIRLISERGIKGTTLGDVGEAAGYSRGLTAHHYKTKEGLIRAVAAEIHRRFYRILRQSAPPEDGMPRLLATIDAYLKIGDTHGARALHLIQKESLTQQSEFRDVLKKFNRLSIEGFERVIRAGIERGEIRSDIDPRVEATLILSALRGARAQWLLGPEQTDIDAVAAAIATQVKRSIGVKN